MYSTLLVYLDPDRDNVPLLQIAGDLAERFHAGLIGVSASQPIKVVYTDGSLPGDIVELDRTEIKQQMEQAREQFYALLKDRVHRLAWRSNVSTELPTDYVARQARSADLIVTHTDYDKAYFGDARHTIAGNLVMQTGRPVLTVPAPIHTLSAKHILVGWKDTREARRAVFDALPFLKSASNVKVVELTDMPLAEAPGGAKDVADWLRQHDVPAESMVAAAHGDNADQLLALAKAEGADLIVSGAYGHHRLREWAFSGVTYNLLSQRSLCFLMSH